MTDLLNALVFGYRLVSYDYFLDHLQEYEIPLLVQGIPQADRPQWEQCRLRTFATASMFSKKNLKLTDIMQFAWDEVKEKDVKAPSKAKRDELKAIAKQFENRI